MTSAVTTSANAGAGVATPKFCKARQSAVSSEQLAQQSMVARVDPWERTYLHEALAGGHLGDDRRGEAHHGQAARPHVDDAAAARLAALLAPHRQRRRGPGADA